MRSQPGDAVQYNAFDTDLQLWVAACLYKGAEDIFRLLRPEPDPASLDVIYHYGRHLGTTLQVTDEMWPAAAPRSPSIGKTASPGSRWTT